MNEAESGLAEPAGEGSPSSAAVSRRLFASGRRGSHGRRLRSQGHSTPRRQVRSRSAVAREPWTPAFAGMTATTPAHGASGAITCAIREHRWIPAKAGFMGRFPGASSLRVQLDPQRETALLVFPIHRGRRGRRGEEYETRRRSLESRSTFANASGVAGRRRTAGGSVARPQTPKLSPQPHRFFTLGLS